MYATTMLTGPATVRVTSGSAKSSFGFSGQNTQRLPTPQARKPEGRGVPRRHRDRGLDRGAAARQFHRDVRLLLPLQLRRGVLSPAVNAQLGHPDIMRAQSFSAALPMYAPKHPWLITFPPRVMCSDTAREPLLARCHLYPQRCPSRIRILASHRESNRADYSSGCFAE